jgi:hypothetical protein
MLRWITIRLRELPSSTNLAKLKISRKKNWLKLFLAGSFLRFCKFKRWPLHLTKTTFCGSIHMYCYVAKSGDKYYEKNVEKCGI